LNEIVKDKTYQVIENIQLFYRKYPLCVCLITSRRNDYLSRRFSEKIPVFDLLPMDEMQRNDFLSKNTKEEIADIIRKSAELIPNQNDFLSVPLFLLMLIRIVERNGNMPNNQALVVEAFLDGIYHLEEQKNPFFNPEQTNILMAHLAKYYFNEYGGNVKIPYSLVAECIRKKAELERFNTDALDFLKKLTEMQILENFRDKYTFKHQLFLDYFFGRDNEIEF
jgi:predicted NACHT family NTPase